FPTGNAERYPPDLVEDAEHKIADLTALVEQHWGEGLAIEWFAPNLKGSPTMRRAWGLFERAAASPGMVAELLRSYREIDVTDVLQTLRVPTLVLHRTGDTAIHVEAGRMIANGIP